MGRKPNTGTSTATIGFEAKLWPAADKLRNTMDAAEWSGATWTTKGSAEARINPSTSSSAPSSSSSNTSPTPS